MMFGDRSRVCTRLICELAAWATGVVILTAPVAVHADPAPTAQAIVVSPFDPDNLPEDEMSVVVIRAEQAVVRTNDSPPPKPIVVGPHPAPPRPGSVWISRAPLPD
jgi:hypothetical protein